MSLETVAVVIALFAAYGGGFGLGAYVENLAMRARLTSDMRKIGRGVQHVLDTHGSVDPEVQALADSLKHWGLG